VPEPRGRFITVEGGEGAGKSTQARRLQAALEAQGRRVLLTREPGGTPGAEALRALLLSDAAAWTPLAETLLHFAARADHVAQVIRPALESGTWVVCDRFSDSTAVYQGVGQGADPGDIALLAAMMRLTPDLTLVLDVPIEASVARMAQRNRGPDRYERLGEAFFTQVRDGFRAVAEAASDRCALIAAEGDADAVAAAVWAAVAVRLGSA